MRLALHSYKPKVVCLTQTIAYDIRESCQSLLDSMHISETQIKFGYEQDATVRMPYLRISGMPFLMPPLDVPFVSDLCGSG